MIGHSLQASEGAPVDSPRTDVTRVVNEPMTADGMLPAIQANDRGFGRLPRAWGPACLRWHARLLSTTEDSTAAAAASSGPAAAYGDPLEGGKVAGATCPV